MCEANGVRIHYVRTGGAKPPVVLLHGLAGSGACWTLLARALEADYDVVMPDARGHGSSSTPETGYRYADFAADVIGLIQGLGLSSPVLVGHSMGGMTAAVVAGEPGLGLRGVVLADPTFLSPQRQREVYESDVVEQHRKLQQLGLDDVRSQALAKQGHRSPEVVTLIAEARRAARLQVWEVLTPPNPDYRLVVSLIAVPLLLVTAERGVVSSEEAEALRGLNGRLRTERISDAGHGLPFDQPERFAGIVRSFLKECLPEAGTA